jgi:hypothetical protein
LPLALTGTALLIALIALLYEQIMQWLWQPMDLSIWLSVLSQSLGWWVAHLLTLAVFTFCFSHTYLERYALRAYRQQHLLIGYGVFSLVMYLVMGFIFSQVLFWAYETSGLFEYGQVLGSLFMRLVGVVQFGVEVVLPLWLCLHLFRSAASDEASVRVFSATTIALCFALITAALNIHLSTLVVQLVGHFTSLTTSSGWEILLILINSMLVALLAFVAAWRALPAKMCGFRGDRLLLASVITLLLWLVTTALSALLLVVLLISGSIKGELVMLVLFGLVQLALLWPFSQLGLRWGYRAQPA